MVDVPVCPICQSPRQSPFATVQDGGREVGYLGCGRCGHVYQSPRMTPEELTAYYARTYREVRQGTDEPVEKDLLAQSARALVALKLMGKPREVARHLDVGSSSGALLEAIRERFGSTAIGVEPGEAYRRYSQARGLRILAGLDDLAEAGEAPFDLVTVMHVLEHLPDPVEAIEGIRDRHMTADALLLVEVPNLAEHESFELAHLHAFTPSSLRDTIRRAGFDVVWSRTHGGYRSPVLRLYITLLARATHEPYRPRYLPLAAFRSRLGRRVGVAKRQFFTSRYPDWTWQSPEKVMASREGR